MSTAPPARVTSRPRLALISPRGPLYRHRSGVWKRSLRYMPLTLATLAALVPEELEAEVTLVDEGIEDVDTERPFDLVGISAITGSARRAYDLADGYRTRGIPVVLGGVHPTLVPDEAQAHADSVVVGYAERTWPELLRDFAAGRMKERYTQARGLSLAGLPVPRRDLLPAGRYTMPHTVEATRGCTYRCEFCVVPTAWGEPLRRPVAEVVDEIRRMGAKKLLFLDLNLNADAGYARELFAALVPLGVRWGGLATTTIASDDALLDLAARSGCQGLLLGFESLCEDSVVETGKAFNLRAAYGDVAERIHARGIAIQGCFVFGFDHDDLSVFERTAAFAIDARIDLPRFAVLTPFPGTPLFSRLSAEGRILHEDWEQYDAQHVVFRPARMTSRQLQEGTERAWKITYGLGAIGRRVLGSRVQLPLSLAANLGYRFYAKNLARFYTCREATL